MSCRAAGVFFSVLSGWCLAGGNCISAKYFGPLHTSSCLVLQYSEHTNVSNDFYVSIIPGKFLQVFRIAALLGKFLFTMGRFASIMSRSFFYAHGRPSKYFFLQSIQWEVMIPATAGYL